MTNAGVREFGGIPLGVTIMTTLAIAPAAGEILWESCTPFDDRT
ncbi:hypothetical protein Pan54_42830 [Rubinisphaera italica]|uniref:Uncharacterized protein n=1 Tax=Rubinisphaera italica TaxID=2527969 RepID=A0A5C5XKR7_9PLAN|nr:hypothetical protein Pan54_42830 [Rubinisphaera italica]